MLNSWRPWGAAAYALAAAETAPVQAAAVTSGVTRLPAYSLTGFNNLWLAARTAYAC
jgi:hypothetical protein